MSAPAELLRRCDRTTVGADPGCDGSLDTFELFLEADLAGRAGSGARIPARPSTSRRAPIAARTTPGLRELVLAAAEWPARPGLKHVAHAWVSAGTRRVG